MATKKVPEVLYRRLLQHLKLRDGTLEDLDGHLEGSFSDGMCYCVLVSNQNFI